MTASNDQSLKVWDIKDQREKVALSGHISAVTHVDYQVCHINEWFNYFTRLCWIQSRKLLYIYYFQYGCIISGSVDGEVKIWSHKGTEITTLRGHNAAVQGCAMTVTMDQGNRESWRRYSNSVH